MSRLLFGVLSTAAAMTAQSQPEVHYVQLPEGHGGEVRDVVYEDFDGDGRPDLIISTGSPESEDPTPRTLRIHLRQRGRPAFRARPDHELQLARNAIAFAIGDVHPQPGNEIVLFAPSVAATAYWREGQAEPVFERLGKIRFLWQPADARVAFAWQHSVRDLDGDRVDDLLIPEPDGYRVLMQRRGKSAADGSDNDGSKARFDAGVVLRVPPQPASDAERTETRFERIELSFGADDAENGPGTLVRVDDRVPAPRAFDWDGDGDLDICALAEEQLLIWAQTKPGEFAPAPTESHTLPDRQRSIVNPSYSAQLADLNADGRADLIVVSSRTIDDEVSSTIEVYLGGDQRGPLGAGGRKASDKLRLRGFVNVPALDDVDGDGRPDLAIGSLRTDVIGQLASAGSSEARVEAQLNVFRNAFDTGKGRFKRPVWLVHRVEVEGVGAERRDDTLARFPRDLDGDGRADLLLRSDRETLQVLKTTERGRRLAIGAELWRLRVERDAPATLARSENTTALIVRERTQVVCVEFR